MTSKEIRYQNAQIGVNKAVGELVGSLRFAGNHTDVLDERRNQIVRLEAALDEQREALAALTKERTT